MSDRWILAFLVAVCFDHAGAHCPVGCLCANTMVECKCTSPSTTASMTLDSFRNIDFVSKVFIHSCANLTIPADAFAGLSIGHELSISSVRTLHIHSYAFRDLVKYPEKFTISNAAIPTIPANAFVGFHRVAHVWFRNVNVSKIAEGAFRHVSDIEYLYFRESYLGRIESQAFANMTNIGHFFVRGKTRIDRVEPAAFQYSKFRKLVFEDARIQSLSAFAFSGPLVYDSMTFDNVTVHRTDLASSVGGHSKLDKITSARKLELVRCRLEHRFPLAIFGSNVHEVTIEDSHIDHLAPVAPYGLQNITGLRFVRSTIHAIDSRAFYGSSDIRAITFQDTSISSVGEKSFGSLSSVEEITFTKCRIGHFPSGSFDSSVVKRMHFAGCHVESLRTGAFGNCQIGHLRFSYSDIKSIEPEAFARLYSDHLGFEYTRVTESRERAFAGLRTSTLNVSSCDLRPRLNETWLASVSVRRFILDANKFACACSSKLTAQLVELRRQRELATSNFLSISNNFCIDESTNATSMLEDYFLTTTTGGGCRTTVDQLTDDSEMTSGLHCTRSLFLVKCTCTENDEFTLDERVTRKLTLLHNATAFMISGCKRLRIARNAFLHFSLTHVIVANCDQVELEADFWWQKAAPTLLLVRIIHIGHLKLTRRAFSFSQPSTGFHSDTRPSVEFVNCTIPTIGSDVFENAQIGSLVFVRSRIDTFEPLFARKSIIDEFTVDDCEIGRLSSWAFNESTIEKLRLERSRIHELKPQFVTERLVKRAFVCFADNLLACQCDLSGLETVANANGCDGPSNLCIEARGIGAFASKLISSGDESSAYLPDEKKKKSEYRCYENGVSSLRGVYDLPQKDTAAGLTYRSIAAAQRETVFWYLMALVHLLLRVT